MGCSFLLLFLSNSPSAWVELWINDRHRSRNYWDFSCQLILGVLHPNKKNGKLSFKKASRLPNWKTYIHTSMHVGKNVQQKDKIEMPQDIQPLDGDIMSHYYFCYILLFLIFCIIFNHQKKYWNVLLFSAMPLKWLFPGIFLPST